MATMSQRVVAARLTPAELPAAGTPVLRARPLRPGTVVAELSVFDDDRWLLTPGVFEDHAKATSVNFAALPAQFCLCAKCYVFQQLDHPEPPALPGSPPGRLAVHTIATNFKYLAAFLHWLDARGIARLGEVTSVELDAYLDDLRSADRTVGVVADRINEVRRLWAYRALLPIDDRLPDAPPWDGGDARALLGSRFSASENLTPRIHPDTMDRLLGWALRFVEVFADDILAARQQHTMLASRDVRTRRPRSTQDRNELEGRVRALLDEVRVTGRALPGKRTASGHREVSWWQLARLLDCPAEELRTAAVRRCVETSGLPIDDDVYLHTPITGRLDGRMWRDRPITFNEAGPLAQHLAAACFVVVAYLSGMRPGEVLTLSRGCVRYDQTAGLWLVHGRKWKGAVDETGAKIPEGEQRLDPWVVVEPVANAIAVLERLHGEALLFPSTLLTAGKARLTAGRQGKARIGQLITSDITRLVAWVNHYCAVSGRPGEVIPPDPVGRDLAPSRFRRTLAWHIVRRPRGLVAGAIQYGHVEVKVTLGYSGNYASGFPDEHAFENWLLRLEQLAEADRRLAAGEHVSGPAKQAYRDRVHQATWRFAGRALTSTRQARTLLTNPALQLFPAKGMTCVFDPDKAKCRLKRTGDDDNPVPDLADGQAGRQNIARTDHGTAVLRQRAAELQAQADDPLSPEPRRERQRHELERLNLLLDEHERTRRSRDLDSQKGDN